MSGTLESAKETPVRGEIGGILVDICLDNSPVASGDFIYQLDTGELAEQREERRRGLVDAQEGMNSTRDDSETRVTQAEGEADATREGLALAEERAHAERAKMRAQVEYAQGQLARVERELTRSQRLADVNYIPGTKLRQAEKAYRRQQFELDQLYAEYADVEMRTAEQVQSAETDLALALHELETARADARSQLEDARIRVAEAERRLADVEEKIAQCTVTAPAAGLAVIQTNSRNWPERRPYRLGDRVEAGDAPVTIYDLISMQVRCQIGEMDIARVRRGQDVLVVSGKGGKRYRGRVALVEELAKEANVWEGGTPGKRVFGVLITLDETDPARLRPGMTVDLEVVLERLPETTLAPIRAVFAESGEQVVYRADDGTFERVPVTTGLRNDLLVEVHSGLRAGDAVALERPPARLGGSAEER
jgi:macrolide-specific efflux system membrane fusion protein